MSDSETAAPADGSVPAACETVKADLDKCIKENGEASCSKLMEAFAACVKSSAKTS